MRRGDLLRAVAKTTGESMSTLKRYGFLLITVPKTTADGKSVDSHAHLKVQDSPRLTTECSRVA